MGQPLSLITIVILMVIRPVTMSPPTYYDVDEIMSSLGFTKADIATVKQGGVVNTGLQTVTERDLATLIGFEAKISVDRFDDLFLDASVKEEADSTVQQLQMANKDGQVDFSSLKLLPKESAAEVVKTYLTFNGGGDLNLSQKEIDMFRALDKKSATATQVEQVLQKVLQGRLDEYKQTGLKGMSPYLRAKGTNFFPGQELQEKLDKAPHASRVAKEFTSYVNSWPSGVKPEGTVETYGWINYNINGKPSIALFHRMLYADKAKQVKLLMNRTFYVSMGHNSVQQFAVASPTSPDTTLFVLSSRTSTDQVSGFGGAAKRTMGSRIMGGRIVENMERIRDLGTKHLEKAGNKPEL